MAVLFLDDVRHLVHPDPELFELSVVSLMPLN